MGIDLNITLLACDPDNPLTAEGMSWQIMTPLTLSGRIQGALSGTYSTLDYQTTYVPVGTGTDVFYYQVMDASGATRRKKKLAGSLSRV